MTIPRPIDHFIRHILPKMDGWCTQEKALNLARNVLNDESFSCVEIGVFAGRSLIAIALALRELGKGGVVYGIDPWAAQASNEGWSDQNDAEGKNREWWGRQQLHDAVYDQCLAYVESLGLNDHVMLLRMTNREAYPQIQSISPLDFLHIDGNHSEDQSCFDVDWYVPLVRPGGTIWMDDTDWVSTKPAQQKLESMCQFDVQIGNCAKYRKTVPLPLAK